MTAKAVVFDIGNVLVTWQPEAFFDREIGADRRVAMFSETGILLLNEEIDNGAPFRASVEGLARRHPQWEAELMLWRDRWTDLVLPVIDGSVALLRALKAKGVPVFALTNFGSETFVTAQEVFPFLREFDRAWVSADLRVMKPDPRIYQILETDSGLSGPDLIFTDDKAENIQAAAARGWQTHLFTGWQGWARRLVEDGFLTKQEAGL
ncbi:HAD family hydrolase [Neotabrizicola sp. VNH66]|uniref:HAD family hydrolase n=1 Tax=Neotabrizicola sp. VNH66 TaxID=3400918 RepID=UPI003C04B5AE